MFRIMLKELREQKKLSQYKLADALGVAQSTVGMWESGKREPDFDTIKKLAEFFGVSIDHILGNVTPKANQLKDLRHSRTITKRQVAQDLNVDKDLITQWENGMRDIDSAMLQKLAGYYNVTSDYILSTDTPKRKGIKIPVLGRVPAGLPLEAVEEIIDYEEISPEQAATGDFFALSVHGTSMEPRIRDGDVVIVRKQSDITSGDTAVVLVNGYDATVKKIIKRENGIVLQPTNPNHEPMFFTADEIRDLPVVVIGRVVELRGKF